MERREQCERVWATAREVLSQEQVAAIWLYYVEQMPVAERAPAKERRWRFELQPLTPQQKAVITTVTVGTAMLMVLSVLAYVTGN